MARNQSKAMNPPKVARERVGSPQAPLAHQGEVVALPLGLAAAKAAQAGLEAEREVAEAERSQRKQTRRRNLPGNADKTQRRRIQPKKNLRQAQRRNRRKLFPQHRTKMR